ncbi:MAG: Crp/Fnr family transcriptional regulator [Deltaproteobacteria bacterium]|nr:Crp/Fnr family transcriptional regulator [Deltaproteobacteria bacterium]
MRLPTELARRQRTAEAVPTKLWYLRRINLFQDLPEAALGEIASLAREETIPRNKVIYFPDEPSNEIFLLKEGRVKLYRLSEDGREVTLAILKPGEVFGELALADEGPRQSAAEALDDVYLCAIKKEDFERILRHHPDLALRISKLMGFRLRSIESRVEELVFRSVPARLARLLLRLAEEFGQLTPEGTAVGISLSHRELAALIGSTRETTTLVLNDFRRRGIIVVQGRRIVIRDPEALTKAS